MKIILEKAGKKFYREWIFRNLDIVLSSPQSIAVLGPNGSGKSTLLQLLAGSMLPGEGNIHYFSGEKKIEAECIFRYLSFASPYIELIEEFSLAEMTSLHFRFKKAVNNFSVKEIITIARLEPAKDKVLKYFSSGMKQRVRLMLALLSDVEMILLDEPCSNLDKESVAWYREMTDQFGKEKLMVVCSNNQQEEFDFCQSQIHLTDYKN